MLYIYIYIYIYSHVTCRVNRAEYVFRIPMSAPQEYVNTYSTCRVSSPEREYVTHMRILPICIPGVFTVYSLIVYTPTLHKLSSAFTQYCHYK